jgi:acyl-coenzyme A thioesterase PaaI-like protein
MAGDVKRKGWIMNLTEIPFVREVGIRNSADGTLELPFSTRVHNHLQTVHAGAQFALAESASGQALQALFPELVGQVVPVLRESQIKFRKPATQSLSAYPSVADENVQEFRGQLARKGRASIAVSVELRDAEGNVTATGVFNWFVQSIEALKA